MGIYTIEPLKCTPEFYNELVKIFPAKVATPSSTIEELMYSAGQQVVLNYIKNLVQGTELSSDVRLTIKPASFINRAINKIRGVDDGS